MPADVLTHDEERAVGVGETGRVDTSGAVEERLALAQRVREAAYDVGAGQRDRSTEQRPATASASVTLSLPHTPHAEEPGGRGDVAVGELGAAPARDTVTTLNSCSGARSASVQ